MSELTHEGVLRTIARVAPDMTMTQALAIADALTLDGPARVCLLRDVPAVAYSIKVGELIPLIKELRAADHVRESLRIYKEAAERLLGVSA